MKFYKQLIYEAWDSLPATHNCLNTGSKLKKLAVTFGYMSRINQWRHNKVALLPCVQHTHFLFYFLKFQFSFATMLTTLVVCPIKVSNLLFFHVTLFEFSSSLNRFCFTASGTLRYGCMHIKYLLPFLKFIDNVNFHNFSIVLFGTSFNILLQHIQQSTLSSKNLLLVLLFYYPRFWIIMYPDYTLGPILYTDYTLYPDRTP